MKQKKIINIRFHADEDLFLADIEDGWIRVGMLDNECFDFAPYHPSYNEVNNLTKETIEKFYDERYAKYAINYYPR